MNTTTPSTEEWRRLFQAADRVKELAPWEWMEEDEVFGVQNPETAELGFVSVMGMMGEHYAVAIYLGSAALEQFWFMHEEPFDDSPEILLETPQLQLSFEDRDTLTDQDRQLIKKLGLKYRGRQSWPMFRSYRAGFFPWYLEAGEARFLTHALEQLLDVAPRFEEDPDLLDPPDEETYLVRTPHQEKGKLVWEDELQRVPPAEPMSIPLRMNMQALAHLKKLKRGKQRLEVDCFWTPAQIQENRKERPAFAYNLMVVDSASGFILNAKVMIAEPTLESIWERVPEEVVIALLKYDTIPHTIYVQRDLMYALLAPLGQELGTKIQLVDELEMLEEVKAGLFSFLYR